MNSAPRSTGCPTNKSSPPADKLKARGKFLVNAEAVFFMQRAISLAGNVYCTSPNPRVGCVLVKGGSIVGEGWHQKPGQGHAEVNALRAAGDAARGATAYVTLEPCCFTGKTPPCTEALVEAGVAEVYIAMLDPNPRVSGKGIERLLAAGIRVHPPGIFPDGPDGIAAQAAALNPGFIKRMQTGMPYVRCKMAMSLDGRTAMASGESQWITSTAARVDVQRMRAGASAIVTGVNTVLSDNPSLNVRPEQLPPEEQLAAGERQPLRVVIDSSLRTPPESRIVTLPGEILFIVGNPHEQQRHRFAGTQAQIHQVPVLAGGRLDLKAAMAALAASYGCDEVMLEAGPTLSGAMLQAGLVDEVVIYIGARLLGSDALPLFNLPGLHYMKDHIGLEIAGLKQIAGDCRITARVINR
jgi:diaminohydroxyphosphoribosylaminopyrimidine deaminase / 5-amino-6-(5-phosphoribosylamino)uracil reductase